MPPSLSNKRIPRKPIAKKAKVKDSSNSSLLPDPEKGSTGKRHRNSCSSIYARCFEDWWLWELLSAILGVAAMVAMYILLSRYNNQRLPQWGSVFGADINLNAVLSLLGLVIKSTLMLAVLECIGQLKWTWYQGKFRNLEDFHIFDDASRGPLGALQMLYKVPRAHLATIGALLSLLSLGLDPFIQQTVQYKSIQVENSTSIALLPVVHDWTDLNLQTESGLPPSKRPSYGIVSTVISAFLEYGDNPQPNLSDVAPTCPTGNCTWSSQVSLGVCGKAADVTSSLKTTKAAPVEEGIGGAFNASLPFDGLKLAIGEEGSDYVLGMFTDFIPSAPSISSFVPDYVINGSNGIALPEMLNPLMHGWIIWQAGPPTGLMGSFAGRKDAQAIEYALEWCARTYDIVVKDGNATVKLSPPESQVPYGKFETVKNDDSTILAAQALEPRPGIFTPNLTVDYDTHFAFVDWLQGLSGTVGMSYAHGVTWPETKEGDGGSTTSTSVDSSLFLSVYNMLQGGASNSSLGGFVPMLDNLGVSMANRMRLLSPTAIPGTSYTSSTHVRVRWPWLALPLLFTLLSIFFFAATVLHQQFSKTYVWKSDGNAVLYALSGGMGRKTEMEGWSGGRFARLERVGRDGEAQREEGRGEKGWRLVVREKSEEQVGGSKDKQRRQGQGQGQTQVQAQPQMARPRQQEQQEQNAWLARQPQSQMR
ncbi:MAG: hypothetical protein Q9227_006158 [Pyrenula ochraceoflavens]